MGREVKRVPMDFDWPIEKVWDGFINPHYRKCQDCDGCGITTARLRLGELIRLILLSGEDTVRKRGALPHPYFSAMDSLHHTAGKIVSPDMLELTNGLSERDGRDIFGYCSTASWTAERKIIVAAGLDPETWGICKTCEGHGEDPSTRAASEAWVETPPPEGDGWQMWETTSEGSPISPVCASPEELAHWLADNGASSFGSSTATYEQWLHMIKGPGWAPSAVITDGKFMSGVEAV